jgi:hypothetical protein
LYTCLLIHLKEVVVSAPLGSLCFKLNTSLTPYQIFIPFHETRPYPVPSFEVLDAVVLSDATSPNWESPSAGSIAVFAWSFVWTLLRRKLNFNDLTNTCTSSPAPAGKGQEADSDVEEVPADHGKVRQVMPPVGKNKKADSDVEVLSADHEKVRSMMRNAISNTRPSVLKNFYCFNGARNEFAKRDTDQQTRQDSCLKTFKSVEKVGICELELFNLRNWYNELRFSNIDTPVSDGEGYVWHFRFVNQRL